MSAGADLPPLVLRCRPSWRLAYGAAASVLLCCGAAVLARHRGPAGAPAAVLAAIVLLASGGGCAVFFMRYCLARLVLSDKGFVLDGPFRAPAEVLWTEAVVWRRVRGGGPGVLRIVHGAARRRLSIPLIYEDSHLLEIGLDQGGFPIV